jgi:predicted ATPase
MLEFVDPKNYKRIREVQLGLRAVAVLTGHGSRFTAAVTVP